MTTFSLFPHATEVLTAIAPLRTEDLGGAFAFVINGAAVTARPSDAFVLSPAVALQLSVDACGRTFVVDDGEVNAERFPFLGAFPLRLSRLFRRHFLIPFPIPIPMRRGGR
jgi:hypothetical protein